VPSRELVAANGLAHSLAALWPSYLAFVTSFVTILVSVALCLMALFLAIRRLANHTVAGNN